MFRSTSLAVAFSVPQAFLLFLLQSRWWQVSLGLADSRIDVSGSCFMGARAMLGCHCHGFCALCVRASGGGKHVSQSTGFGGLSIHSFDDRLGAVVL